MHFFSEDSEYINAECEKCNRVIEIKKDDCLRTENGYTLMSPAQCVCGEIFNEIIGHHHPKPAIQSHIAHIEIEKRENKFLWRGIIIGCLIGLFINPGFWGVLIGCLIGAIVGVILFRLTTDKQDKKELDEWRKQIQQQKIQQQKASHSQSLPKIECPTCHSHNVEKISTGKKLTYIVGFGILAPAFKKVRSQFECKKCGYKW